MAVQVQTDNTLDILYRGEIVVIKQNQVLLQDAGRSGDLVYGTLMAKISASQKLVPFTDETAVDGSAIPYGFYIGADIPEADIIAGDVEDIQLLIGGVVHVDQNLITIENTKLLTTVIQVGTTLEKTVNDWLELQGLYMQDTVEISSFA
jgi:small-conductance mechanosensitive channel